MDSPDVYTPMIVGGDTARKSIMSDSPNPKPDVLTGWSTLIPCLLLCHFHLQTSE